MANQPVSASPLGVPHLKTNPGDDPSVLNQDQVQNVQTIIAVGKAAGMPQSAIISALATANDESTFLNYANSKQPESFQFPHQAVGSDGQSVGVFQQQVGYGWGDYPAIMDVAHQAAAFYGVAPDTSAPGVLQTDGWQKMDPGTLAQTVQQSGTPYAYYPLVQFANKLWGQYGNTPAATNLPFKFKATGPEYVKNTVAAIKSQPAPVAPVAPPPTAGMATGDVSEQSAGKSFKAPAAPRQPMPSSGGRGNAVPAPRPAPMPAAPPAQATANAGPAPARGPGLDKAV